MSDLKTRSLRLAVRLEAAFARLRGERRTPEIIEPYTGYSTPHHVILLGRVHHRLDQSEPDPAQGKLANVAQMLGRFRTSEVAGAVVRARSVSATTDEEGYFRLEIPRRGDGSGWIEIDVTLDANGATWPCPALVAPDGTGGMIISDIDDTVMRTGAYSLGRNLWTTFTGNAMSRDVFSDAAVLLDRLHRGGERPVYYVSSSPWNIHYFLNAVFRRGSVVRGPMFLRDLGISETKLITEGHGNHKGAAIDTILAANPERHAVLMGDTGQKDARIYREVIARHPDRVQMVVLRTPGPGLDHSDRRAIAALEETGVPVLYDSTFAAFRERIDEALS